MVGSSLTSAFGPAPIVYAGAFGNPLCPLGAFPPGTFTNQIVVCDRGGDIARLDKAQSVLDGGADGFVLANEAATGNQVLPDGYVLPGVHITYNDGVTLKAWLASGTGHMAAIAGTTVDLSPANGDVMADFSSRGPSVSRPDVLKPDVTAPGVLVWAANMNGPTPPEYMLLSGTSMSSPHSAGAAALVRAQHPTWTPPMVKSAIMLTAQPGNVVKEDGMTPATPFDRGAGRVDLTGAGRVGFVLDETAINFSAANPAADGDPTTLNLASLADGSCFLECSWDRTVLSVASASRTYTATPSAPYVTITTTNPFTLGAGAARSIGVSVDVSQLPKDQWHFPFITFSDGVAGTPDLRMPIAVFAAGSTDGLTLNKTADPAVTAGRARIDYAIQVSNNNASSTSYTVTDPIPANTTYIEGSATGGLTFNPGPQTLTGTSGTLDPVSFSLITQASPFGYVAPASLSGGFFNICTLTTQCDETTLGLTGVDFFYQGVRYDQVRVHSNGLIAPGPAQSFGSAFENQNLPDPTLPNNAIAAFWADLDGDGTSTTDPGAGFYYFGGHEDPGNGDTYLVLGWEGIQLFNDPSQTYTFQIWIKDGTDQMWFVYQAINGGLPDGADGGLTVGLENSGGTAGFTRFYREYASCSPGPCNDTGTPPAVGTDLKVNTVLDSATFTFSVNIDRDVMVGTLIQNIVTATSGTQTVQAVADTLVSAPSDLIFEDGFEPEP
jgi:uncharacterized repeat protein (TIGR01451 family)